MCLLVGFPEDPVTLLVQFFLLGLQLFFQIFDFGLVAGNLHAFFFDGDTVFFQGGDHILEGLVFLADLFFCIILIIYDGSPSLLEMAKALLFPGTPISKR